MPVEYEKPVVRDYGEREPLVEGRPAAIEDRADHSSALRRAGRALVLAS